MWMLCIRHCLLRLDGSTDSWVSFCSLHTLVEINWIYRRKTHFPTQINNMILSWTECHIKWTAFGVCMHSINLCEGNQNNVHKNNFHKMLFTQFHITESASKNTGSCCMYFWPVWCWQNGSANSAHRLQGIKMWQNMCACGDSGMPLKFRVIVKLVLDVPSGKIAILNVFYSTH